MSKLVQYLQKRVEIKWKSKGIRSIKYRLAFSFSLVVTMVIVLIVMANLLITNKIVMKNIRYYSTQTINETSDKIDSALNKVEIASQIINNNSQIQQAILQRREGQSTFEGDTYKNTTRKQEFNQPINDITNAIGDIHSIGIHFTDNDHIYFGIDTNTDDNAIKYIEKQFPKFITSEKNILWVTTHDFNGNNVISLVRKFIDTMNLEQIGYMEVNVENRYLNNFLNNDQLGKSASIFLIDGDGVIICCKKSEQIGKKLQYPFTNTILKSKEGAFNNTINHIPMIVTYYTSPYTGWKIVGLAPMSELNSDILKNQTIIVLIGICGLMVSLLLSIIIAYMITKPINGLRRAMKEVEQGKLEVTFEDSNFIETRELGEGFKEMLRKLRELLAKVYEGELRKKEAEFKAMQAQINPHFLYNTLETINYMLIIENKHDISKIVTYLGDILRYSINKGKGIITLTEDLNQIEKYLYIQKIRFGDRLQYKLFIEDDTKKCFILKLLIQPIVENAIIHGIEKKRGQGMLTISTSIEHSMLVIQIKDNGMGIPSEKLDKILKEESLPQPATKHTHLGVSNVNQRIKLFYGEEYGLDIESKVGEGTCVKLIIPVDREE